MEEKNKYYIPELSDMYIGYEYERAIVIGIGREFEEDGMYPVDGWKKAVVEIEGRDDRDVVTIPHDTYTKYYRTKYLDRSQIESLNWIWDKRNGWYKKENAIMTLGIYTIPQWVNIDRFLDSQGDEKATYQGYCKSINELKILMRMLDIPE